METSEEIRTELHAQYMDGLITHQAYYEWLAEMLGIRWEAGGEMCDRVLASTDPYLNDIPLYWWDAHDMWTRRRASRAGFKSWSLSDTVCVQKAAARRFANETLVVLA